MMKINLMLISCIMGILVVFLPSISAQEVGYNYEIHEENGVYTATIYSNYVYYPEGEYWERINESYDSIGCNTGYDFCQPKKNLYKTHMTDDTSKDDFLAFEKEGELLFMSLDHVKINGKGVNLKPKDVIVENNQVTYVWHTNYWGTYTYTPTILKEQIFINSLDQLGEVEIQFHKKDSNKYALIAGNYTICDYEGYYCEEFEIIHEGDLLKINFTAFDWFPNATLPLVIDPTISINDTFWDGSVYQQTVLGEQWARSNTTQMNNLILLGQSARRGVVSSEWGYEGDVDYNLSYFEDLGDLTGLDVQEIILYYNVTQAPSNDWGATFNFSINEMEYHPASYHYRDTEAGNKQFWLDISNGTTWNLTYDVSLGIKTANLTNGADTHLEALLSGGTFNWSMGLYLEPYVRPNPLTDTMRQMKIAGKAYAIPSSRHYINITYVIVPPAPAAVVFPPVPNPFFWVYYDLLVWVLCISLLAGFLIYIRL